MNIVPIPKLLSEIPDTPTYLYIRGTLPELKNTIVVTIVGSRKYSKYGKHVCQQLIAGLQGYPFVIVSGLAIGIDTIAHQTALEVGLPCIAIPGSGLHDDVLYPRRNKLLAQRIIKNGGCLLSEYQPDFKATRWSFPKRNRMMAGISHAVLVIEAQKKSGTLITANLALEYGREVLVVPGAISDHRFDGGNNLIQQGAYPITSAQDILRYFNIPL